MGAVTSELSWVRYRTHFVSVGNTEGCSVPKIDASKRGKMASKVQYTRKYMSMLKPFFLSAPLRGERCDAQSACPMHYVGQALAR